jgi:hypothetical protein
MKKYCIAFATVATTLTAHAQSWTVQSIPLQTRWTKQVSPANALPEYPRPQMQRREWTNLNGLWLYAIEDSSALRPARMQGSILVPYPIESSLSGVKKMVQPNQYLWYQRSIQLYDKSKNKKYLLHFGAVDWQATIFINGKQVGMHTGGYDNFSLDITDHLHAGENELIIKVYDPTDQGPNPHGKQVLNPKDIWYTPTTGIWQTVWMESVPKNHITSLAITPVTDSGYVRIKVNSNGNERVELSACNYKVTGQTNQELLLRIPEAKLWSPENPYLYELVVKTKKDEVKSYFGMRKVEIRKDAGGADRIFLNNQYVFNLGVLDQGFWPDGIYTAPTDEALAFDIQAIKAMGFNTIRKHIKREPERWYYWCDKIGIMVWQDMVNPSFIMTEEAKQNFEKESKTHIEQLYNHPCITTWVLFNEKWGQYEQERLSKWIKGLDPTRLLNGHSGEILYVNEKLRSPSPNAWIASDIVDIHSYPDPMHAPAMQGKARVLGEFGGIGVFISDHQWNTGSAWGYINVTPAQLKWKYTIMSQHLQLLAKEGLSASIYTQPFDVEGEQNGLLTYDREIVKIPFEEMRKIHAPLVPTAPNMPAVSARSPDLTEATELYAELMKQYINGKRDPATVKKLAMMAGQTNDAAGRSRFSAAYIASLKKPYSDEAMAFIEVSTKKVTDPGFNILVEKVNEAGAENARPLQVKLMNIIYEDVIATYVPNAQAKPDWNEIYAKVKAYGSPGEEIYLRAKTIHLLNQQDWQAFRSVAREYLAKYGAYAKPEEKKILEEKLQ